MTLEHTPPQPDVTVVIPCHNAERWVARAIQSALDQEGVTVEVIVVDDGSTDASLDVIKSFGDRISWQTGPNRGACAARNRGLELATAPFVMFLDADDYLEPHHLKTTLAAFGEDLAGAREWDVVFTRHLVDDEQGGRREIAPPELQGADAIIRYFITGHFTPPCGTVWSTEFVRAIGGWREDVRRHQDAEIVYRALAAGARARTWPHGGGVYFQHGGPARISGRLDSATVASCMDVFELVAGYFAEREARCASWGELRGLWAYSLYRLAARSGDRASIARAEAIWRRVGDGRHRGSLAHRVVCRAIGLPRKEDLSARLRRRLRPSPSRKAPSDRLHVKT